MSLNRNADVEVLEVVLKADELNHTLRLAGQPSPLADKMDMILRAGTGRAKPHRMKQSSNIVCWFTREMI